MGREVGSLLFVSPQRETIHFQITKHGTFLAHCQNVIIYILVVPGGPKQGSGPQGLGAVQTPAKKPRRACNSTENKKQHGLEQSEGMRRDDDGTVIRSRT